MHDSLGFNIMNTRKSVFIVWKAVIFLILLLTGCSRSTSVPESLLRLSIQDTVDVSFPPGDRIYQDGEHLLLLSSFTLERPPTTVIAFSLERRQQEWLTSLPAPPIQALPAGDSYLIATIPSETSGKAYALALNASTGQIEWRSPLGQAMVALASDDKGRIWAAWEKGVSQLDPETGAIISQAGGWERDYGKHRVLATWGDAEVTYLAVAAGRRVFLYREEGGNWDLVWSFQSGGRVLELHPLAEGKNMYGWLVLAHSYAYGVGPEGQILWRVENSDYNLDAWPVRCAEGTLWGFRNVVRGLYLVDRQGVVRTWKLPGGNAHVGPIPLPFPEHLAFGLSIADLDGDGEDELTVRSLKRLFVFNCQANLLATALIDSSGDKMVTQLRQSRLHRPAIFDQEVVVAKRNAMLYLSLHSR